MDKQPDKLDVLMDWFLGDAKEILEAMKLMKAEQADMLQRLGELKSALELTWPVERYNEKKESQSGLAPGQS